MTTPQLLGYLGGFLIAVALTPQLVKTYKTKSAKDISLLWTLVSLLGLMLYGIYAALDRVYPLLTFASIESLMIAVLILMKVRYDRQVK